MKKYSILLISLLLPISMVAQDRQIPLGKTSGFLETTQCIIKYLPDGQSILAAFDYNIKHISLQTGKTLRTWWTDYPIWDMALSPDGRRFAVACSSHSGNATGRISIWNLSSTKVVMQLRSLKNMGFIGRIAFSPDGQYLAGAGDPEDLIVWKLSTGETIAVPGQKWGNMTSLIFHPTENILVVGNLYRVLPVQTQLFPDARAFFYDLETMKMTRDFPLWALPPQAGSGGINTDDVPEKSPGYFEWEKYTLIDYYSGNYSPHSVSFSPKARFLLAAGREVSVYNADTGEKLLTYTQGGSTHYYGAFHPFLKNVMVSSQHGFEWYDGVKGTLLASYPVSKSPGFYPLLFDFSPDGKSFIHAEYDRGPEETLIIAVIRDLKAGPEAKTPSPLPQKEERDAGR